MCFKKRHSLGKGICPKGAADPTGGIKEGWKNGEVHGAFEIISSLAPVRAAVKKAKWNVALLTSSCLVVILAVVWMLVRRNILKPLESAKELIGHISDGDLTQSPEAAANLASH